MSTHLIRALVAGAAMTLGVVAAPATAGAWEMQVGSLTTVDSISGPKTATSVTFADPFDSPPVVFVLPTTTGNNSAVIRLADVTASGFSMTVAEDPSWDGPHVAMSVTYIAVEQGEHTLPDGTSLVVGTLDTTDAQVGANFPMAGTWDDVTFGTPFGSAPVVVTQVQTMANEEDSPPTTTSQPFMSTAVRDVTAAGFDVAIERSEVVEGTITLPETIGYIAMDSGVSSSFSDRSGTAVPFITTTATGIRRWDAGCSRVNFGVTFPQGGRVFAGLSTREDTDGGWLRRCGAATTTRVDLTIDEDRSNDGERGGTASPVHVIGFGRDFVGEFEVPGTVEVVEDEVEVGDTLQVRVSDLDLVTTNPATITVSAATARAPMDTVIVTLTRTVVGTYEGTLTTTAGATTASALNVLVGDSVEVTYADAAPVDMLTDAAIVIGCGDAVVQQVRLAETCDDGGVTPGDGCDAACLVEPGYTCPTEGGVCATVVVDAPADGAFVNTARPAFSGTATNGFTVSLTLTDSSGTVFTQDVVAAGGTWSYTPAFSIADGAHEIEASVSTSGGLAIDGHDFTIDTAAPAVAITDPATAGTSTGEKRPTISGSVEAGSSLTVTLSDSGGGIVATLSQPSAAAGWSLQPSADLADGTYTISAMATDEAGNVGTASSDITVDNSLPGVAITSPSQPGTATTDGTPALAGTCEPGTNLLVQVSTGGVLVDALAQICTGTWSFSPTLAEGTYDIVATATDGALNSASAISDITVDQTAPAVAITTPASPGTTTGDANFEFEGTTEAGVQLDVTLRLSGAIVETSTIDPAPASWSFEPSAALVDGSYSLEVVARDEAGNVAFTFTTLDVDLEPPSITITNPPARGTSTAEASPTIRGATSNGATVSITVSLGAAVIYTDTIASSGINWSFAQALADEGTYEISVTATDAQGNSATATSDLTVDRTGPNVDITAPAADALLADARPDIEGTAGADATSIQLDVYTESGTLLFSATPQLNAGVWDYTPSLTLPDGRLRAVATATDSLGNTTTDESFFSIDTAAAVAITAPVDGTLTAQNLVTVTGTGDAGADISLRIFDAGGAQVILDATTVLGDGSWSIALLNTFADGTYRVTVELTDTVGNTDTDEVEITIDTVTTVTIQAPTGGAVTASATPEISGVAEADATVTVSVAGADGVVDFTGSVTADAAGNWSITTTALDDDDYDVVAQASDTLGNTASDSETFNVLTTAPALNIDSPNAGASVATQRPTVQGTTDPNETVTLVIEGVTYMVTADGNGDWSFLLPTDLAEGVVLVEASVTNAANLSANASRTFSVDVTDPTVSITSPVAGQQTNDRRVPITGTAEPGSEITLTLLGGATVTVNAGADGSWTYTPTSDWPEGSTTVSAIARDDAGNTSSPSSVAFVLDYTAPSVQISAPLPGSRLADATPTFEGGTSERDEVVLVLTDSAGGVIFSRTQAVDAAGDFLYTPVFQLPDNDYIIAATATDAAGNSATASLGFTVDTTAPTIVVAAPADGDTISDASPVVSGTTEADAEVSITVLDELGAAIFTGSVTADGSGDWSLDTAPTVLPDGAYTVLATAEDAAGNTSQASSAFGVDTVAPGVSIVTPADGSRTSNRLPAFSGNSEPGSTVRLTVSSGGVTSIDVDLTADAITGAWSYTPALGEELADGTYDVDATATDAAGNTGSDTSTFTVDLTAPALAIATPASGSTTNVNEIPITGTSDASATLTITVRNGAGAIVFTDTVTADAFGAWDVTSAALVDGSYTVEAVADDGLGNTSTDSVSFAVDTAAPGVSIDAPADAALVSDPQTQVVGGAEAGALVTIEIVDSNGDVVAADTLTVDVNGWTLTPGAPLPDGDYTITVVAEDAAGNVSTVSSTYTIDATAPLVRVITPVDGAVLAERDVSFEVEAEEGAVIDLVVTDDSGVEIFRDTVTVDASGNWQTSTGNPLPDGDYFVTVTGQDAAGNTSTDTVSFRVDSTEALVTLDVPTADASVPTATPTLSGTADPDATLTLTVGDNDPVTLVTDASGAWTYTVPEADALPEGDVAAAVEAERPNGSTATASVDFVVDLTAPEVAIASPGEGAVLSDPTPVISGTGEPGATVTVTIDDAAVGAVVIGEDGTWSLELDDAASLSEGEHVIGASAVDAAGNGPTDATPVTFTVDTEAPLVTLTTPVPGNTVDVDPVVVTGTTDPGATVTITIDGVEVGTAVAGDDGVWTFTPDAPLGEGSHTVEVSTEDAAGNTSTTGEITFEVDTIDPEVTVTSPRTGDTLDDGVFTVAGTATPGFDVEVLVDGVVVGIATADENGDWSYTLEDALSEGDHDIQARVTEDGDSVTSEIVSVTVDFGAEPPDRFLITGGACDCAVSGGGSEPAGPLAILLVGLVAGLVRRRR